MSDVEVYQLIGMGTGRSANRKTYNQFRGRPKKGFEHVTEMDGLKPPKKRK